MPARLTEREAQRLGFVRGQPAAPRRRKARTPPLAVPAPEPEPERIPPGAEVVRFSVLGRAVPWSVPTVPRSGPAFKSPRLRAWQRQVALVARLAMGSRPPWPGPARLVINVHHTGGAVGDWTNLAKSTEDAIQGIAVVNDRQVVEAAVRKVRSHADWTDVVVYAAREG